MWKACLAAVAVTACWSCSAAAQRAADVEIGVLTCTLGPPGETSASSAPSAGQARGALCTFKPKRGAEEMYAGQVKGVSISADQKGALIWLVKSTSGAPVEPGLLQQVYENEPGVSPDQNPPLIGGKNSEIALHSMADKSEGSASAPEKAAPAGFIILSIELALKSASG
jgi:hypothetical protein